MNSLIEYIIRTIAISIREQFFLIMFAIWILKHFCGCVKIDKKIFAAVVLFGALLSNLPDLLLFSDSISLLLGILIITGFIKYLTKASAKLTTLVTLSSFGVYMAIESLIVLVVTRSTNTALTELKSLKCSLIVAAIETVMQLFLLYFLYSKKTDIRSENSIIYAIMNSKKHFRITIIMLASLIMFLGFYAKLFLYDGILASIPFLQAVLAWTLIVFIFCVVLYVYIEGICQAYANSSAYTKCLCESVKENTEKAIRIATDSGNKELMNCLKEIYATVDFSE